MYPFELSIEHRVIIGISAMVLLFSGFLISFITSQRKKLQYHKDLQLLHEQQRQLLVDQNTLLEQRVSERTTELSQQKEALQTSLINLKATQMRLIQREKLASLGELTAGVAHEIQNPLNFVNNFSEVSTELVSELEQEQQKSDRDLKLETELLSDLKHNLQKITHHGSRASSIVKGMLEHSRPSTGERQPTDMNKLADEYLRLAYQGFRQAGSPTKDKNSSPDRFNCALQTELDPALDLIEVVPQDIGRVLLNLFNNAFYTVQQRARSLATGEAYVPTVSVSTRQVADTIEIHVRDNGMGIAEGLKSKIFQPFFTTKPTGEGTGLGLSLSYDIVTKGHGGDMTVESVDGEGSEFVVSLPIKNNG